MNPADVFVPLRDALEAFLRSLPLWTPLALLALVVVVRLPRSWDDDEPDDKTD